MQVLVPPWSTVASEEVYRPNTLAFEVYNLEDVGEGILRTVGRGRLLQDSDMLYPSVSALYYANLDGGERETWLMRSGAHLLHYQGWLGPAGAHPILAAGIHDDIGAYPDQIIEVNGKLVWRGGSSRAVVFDGEVATPLGFDTAPSPPTPFGPDDSGHPVFRNNLGYAHPGRLGTIRQNGMGAGGMLQGGTWSFKLQYEGYFGDLSPLSAPVSVSVRPEKAAHRYGEGWLDRIFGMETIGTANPLGLLAVVEDDLSKSVALSSLPIDLPAGATAVRVYRTADLQTQDGVYFFQSRIPGAVECIPVPNGDDELGQPAREVAGVPVFDLICAHRGKLIGAVGGKVMASEAGFVGTFYDDSWCIADSSSRVTGLASFGGSVWIFTENGAWTWDTVGLPVYVGPYPCAAGCSLQVTAWNSLVWMGSDCFFEAAKNGVVRHESLGVSFGYIDSALRHRAVSVFDSSKNIYRCAVRMAGETTSTLFCYTQQGWTTEGHGYDYLTFCKADGLVVAGASLVPRFIVLGAPARGVVLNQNWQLTTNWLRVEKTGRTRCNLSRIYIGFVEEEVGDIQVDVFQNGRPDTVWTGTLVKSSVDEPDRFDTAVVGTAVCRRRRLFWRHVEVHLRSVEQFRVRLSGTSTVMLSGLAFDVTATDNQGSRIPRQ